MARREIAARVLEEVAVLRLDGSSLPRLVGVSLHVVPIRRDFATEALAVREDVPERLGFRLLP